MGPMIFPLSVCQYVSRSVGKRVFSKTAHKMFLKLLMKLGALKVTSAKKRQFLEICHLKHRLRIFLFRKKFMFRSQEIQFFVFLTIS